jgi:hypothetical protein
MGAMRMAIVAALFLSGSLASAQKDEPANDTEQTHAKHSHSKSAKHDIGSGAGDIGKGAAKGAGSAASGAGHAAADLATLHPVNAATDLGKGAVGTGKNAGVGAAKGTGKIIRGTGKALKHVF